MSALQAARICKLIGVAGGLRWLMDREHVGTPVATVERETRERVRKSFAPGKAIGPDAARLGPQACEDACATYAVMVHKHNRRSYERVMGGRV